MKEITQTHFDYSEIDPAHRLMVRQKTTEIRDRIGRAAQNIVEIGARLAEVKAAMKHGEFGKWLAAEFGMTDRTARNMMAVSDKFKTETVSDLNIAPSALYLLAGDKVPDEVRGEIVDRAKSGERITKAKAKEAVKVAVQRREPETATPNPAELPDDPADDDDNPPEPAPPADPLAAARVAHNAPIEAAIAHMEADARAVAAGIGDKLVDGEHKLSNPESSRLSSWSGTVRVILDATKALKANLIVENPKKPGDFIIAASVQRIKPASK